MANEISKIKLPNNTTYDIKDVSARSAAATAQSTADGKISSSLKGVANGVAELDANGLVPTSQLPSYVDDVLEYATKSVFPTMGESGKIYVDISTNLTYRWSGTAYVEISPSLALGETSSTAYRGDRGKTAYTHATDSNRLTTATAVGLYKVGATTQGHVSGLTAVAKADITALGIPAQDTTYSSGTGITISGTTINHSNSVTAGTAKGDNTKTLSFGGTFTIPTVTYDAQGHITAKGTTTMTMPSNPNTDTKVTAVGNHYTPAEDSTAQLDADASSTTAATWNSTSLVTGITVKRDAKGHVTGITVDSIKMPANPNTNTTYTIGTSGNNITLTPSSGSAQSITAPYATSAGSATSASKLGSSNVGSATNPIYLSSGTATACTYSLGATVNGGTSGRIAYYNGANAISSSGGLKYYTANSTATSPATQTVLEVFGQTYGNDAAYLKSGTAGVLSYGDGSPQIRMSASENGGQNGALMFTDHDTAGTGASFHFVSDQSDWNVTSKRFHARTGISIGTNLPHNWNGLQIQEVSQNWLQAGQAPAIYMKKNPGGGASGALGMDTKTGRVVIATYPANDDLLYFNWYNDTTLAGTDNKYDAQMKWTPSTNTLSTNISGNASTISNFRVSTTSSLGIAVAYNAIGYVSGLTSSLWNYNRSDGALYTQRYNDKYQHEIYADYRTGRMSVRGHNNGTWEEWKRVIVDEVLTNQDLDDVTIPGFYRAAGDNTVTNTPVTTGAAFGLIVVHAAAGSYYYQIFNHAGTNNTWRRSCNNGTWSAWVSENISNTDVNVKVNNTNPTTGTWYYPVWYTGTSGTGNVNANDGFRYHSLQGTASAVGAAYLQLGNATASGTAGNKRGFLRLYAEKAGHADIVYTASATGNSTHTFPTTGGTILNTGTTSFTQSLSSGTKIGTIKINGTSTDLYCQTNTNTHRPIQVNGTEILGNNTTALNLKAGSNVSVTNSSGTVTIAATNTNDAVTQTETTTNASYDILFSASTSGTATKTEGVRKSDKIKFNPSQQTLTIGSGNDESIISNVDIKTKQYELRSPDKTLSVKMKLDNNGQTAIFAEDNEGTMLWYNNYINSDGTLQWNNPINCSEAFSCTSFLSGQIELKQASPYIDFHHNNSTADFTSRIITTNLAELTFYGRNSSGTTVYGTCRGAAFTVVSSKYMKENIKDIEDDEAKKLLQLRPVSFDYKYTGETNKRGLIAEEVLEVMPEMVYVPEDYSEPMDDTIPDNVPSIDYSKFVPYLIKMVQIQQQEIDQLKEQIK